MSAKFKSKIELSVSLDENKIPEKIFSLNIPILGICLGMQLMFEKGTENGDEEGLKLFPGICDKFKKIENYSLPHIGFNLVNSSNSKIWKNTTPDLLLGAIYFWGDLL